MSIKYLTNVFNEFEMSEKKGHYFDTDNIEIINEDTDCYVYDENNQHFEKPKLLFKFRKNIIPKDITDNLFDNLKDIPRKHTGRPWAAGIPENGLYSTYISKNNKIIRKMNSTANSGIVGFYDNVSYFGHMHKTETDINCRQTAFNKHNLSKYNECLHGFQYIDKLYKQLLPEFYEYQKTVIDKIEQKYVIEDTVFTTVTVNKNFQTALHKDKGDLKNGFGNLMVVSNGDYNGGYTLFPQYGIGVDCRNGDFLLMDVHEWHCNSPIELIDSNTKRLSFVFYLREKMVSKCQRALY